jgi:hypothetical protein
MTFKFLVLMRISTLNVTEKRRILAVTVRQTSPTLIEYYVSPDAVDRVAIGAALWGMMILSFCGLGFMAYRRKSEGSFRFA